MKLIKTSLFSAIITLIKISSGFIVSKVVAIITGPSGVALIGQFMNFITVILTFSNGGINNGVVKYTAEFENDDAKLKNLFSTSLRISIYCSLVIGVFLILLDSTISLWIFNTTVYNNIVKTLGITIILYSINSLLIAILNGKKQLKSFTIVNILGSIISLIFTLVLVYFYKVEGALYSLVLSQSIIFFVTLIIFVKSQWFSWQYFGRYFDKAIALKLGQYSLMAIATALTIPISQILIRKMIIEKLGIDDAGYWQGMMKISDGYLMIVTTSLNTYYLPKLSSLKEDKDIQKEILDGYKIILPIVFLGCIIIYYLRFFIIDTLYTPAFREMEKLFIFQLLGDFFKIAAWILAYLMMAKAMIKTYIITEIIFNITYVAASYMFIDYFQLQGVTIVFFINYTLYFLLMIFIFRKILFIK
ncbi:MAG: O-antigen translocase [Flectobacillus sp.]|nr:O-antigen translocase [Flectobacillus sp.]